MKKVSLLFLMIAVCLCTFAQSKYQPKVVVLFMGEKNATFDESKFPDCKFYYTPGITAEVKEAKSATGMGLAAMGIKKEGAAYDITYSGAPAEAYSFAWNGGIFFDKDGVVSGLYKSFKNVALSPKKNMQGVIEFADYNAFAKDYVKKSKLTKKAKKDPKKPTTFFDYHGKELPGDFEVQDASGNKTTIKDLVKGENLTLLYTLYLKPDCDFKAGMESGKGKKGKEWINANINTAQAIAKLKTLEDIEYSIFGHKVVW